MHTATHTTTSRQEPPKGCEAPLETLNQTSIRIAIKKGIHSLAEAQGDNGAWDSVSCACSVEESIDTNTIERRTTFATSLILLCLEHVSLNHEAKKIITTGVDFLLKERSSQWSWNYWQRESHEYLTMPYPDDLDDTMCALAAIHAYRPDDIGGEALGHIVQLLTFAEKQPGGPYFTWLYRAPASEKTTWDDIDPIVNANIAFFLKRHEDITLPNITTLLEKTVEKILNGEDGENNHNTGPSKYYCLPVSILYFISRACPELAYNDGNPRRTSLMKYLLDTKWKNPLETALALSAFINFGFANNAAIATNVTRKMRELAAFIVMDSRRISGWNTYPFYIETIRYGKKHYSGSSALTTAFCIEALNKYLGMNSGQSDTSTAIFAKKEQNAAEEKALESMKEIENAVIEQYTRYFDALPALQKHIGAPLDKVTTGDVGKHVTLLPYFFYTSLNDSLKRSPSANANIKKLLIDLGVANLAGWVSYRIYDDILDEEGHPEMLPLANVSLRLATDIYARYLPGKYRAYFDTLMNNLEVANTVEREQSYQNVEQNGLRISRSLPLTDYAKNSYALLADKSLPHCLGPVAILANLNLEKTSGAKNNKKADITHTINFFRHYIIARQLNDDAHDWLQDLKRNFLNSASVEVIKLWKKSRKQGDMTSYHVEDIECDLQSIFWHEAIIPLAKKIKFHTRKAAASIRLVKSISDTSIFDALLAPLAGAATQALSERQKMLDFLETMR